MERGQFTFYRSFFDAIREIGAEDQAAAYHAICAYALDEELPNISGAAKAVFLLAKPNLDASRRKAENAGRRKSPLQTECGGEANREQNESGPAAKGRQAQGKREKKREIETENECYTPLSPLGERDFDTFWRAYPKKVGKQPARKAFGRVKAPLETLLAAIERQKRSSQWCRDKGQFIPNPATWLNQGRWEDELEAAHGDSFGNGAEAAGRYQLEYCDLTGDEG